MTAPQKTGEITRETYEPIGTVEYFIFYFLVAVTLLVFFYGVYRLPRRMPRGLTPWMKPTLGDTNH